tara:strand:+ start:344 stop:556 length:213 start_codon:yes stop_codon:yes gene_type:complete
MEVGQTLAVVRVFAHGKWLEVEVFNTYAEEALVGLTVSVAEDVKDFENPTLRKPYTDVLIKEKHLKKPIG